MIFALVDFEIILDVSLFPLYVYCSSCTTAPWRTLSVNHKSSVFVCPNMHSQYVRHSIRCVVLFLYTRGVKLNFIAGHNSIGWKGHWLYSVANW